MIKTMCGPPFASVVNDEELNALAADGNVSCVVCCELLTKAPPNIAPEAISPKTPSAMHPLLREC